jgi:dTDP-4-dehydrorhamnose 3,5-epimerase-like enzyme
MDIVSLAIPDVKLVRPKRSGDARGWFMETYRRDRMADAGVTERRAAPCAACTCNSRLAPRRS